MSSPEVRLWKATRPDGTDFRTGKLDYASRCGTGVPVIYPGSAPEMAQDDPGTYLSMSAEPGEVLTGGRWPCRLFRVEPVGEVIGHSDMAFKRCARSLLVVEEVPAHEALGPNGAAVAAVVERAGRLSADEIIRLIAARHAAGDAARDAARHAAGYAARHAARYAAWDAARYAAWHAARYAAWYAAWDAAGGMVVRDLISDSQFHLLAGPWLEVMGDA